MCVCKNCSMVFFGEYAKGVPLSIPVQRLDGYTPIEVQVIVNERRLPLRGELVTPFRRASIEEITEETRFFIDHVQ